MRLAEDQVKEAYEEIRRLVAERSHYSTTWWIDDRATPADLADRLLAVGLRPAEEPRLEAHGTTGLALVAEPPAVKGVPAREVESVEEWLQAAEIGNDVFGARQRGPDVATDPRAARLRGGRGARRVLIGDNFR